MSNRAIAEQILKGKKTYVRVKNLRHATAVRVAGHRLGGVLTVTPVKGGFKLVKSKSKVTHRPAKKMKPTQMAPQQNTPAAKIVKPSPLSVKSKSQPPASPKEKLKRPAKPVISNRALAEQVLKGKKTFIRVPDMRAATAVRVAAHRLGKVLTVKADKQGFKLFKSSARIAHRR
ncbi:hypothetical protein [Oleiharenicola lentus]|uniref:hypothetical protein n=1 Tax=Oleiharenicola lentus TaxID=2508720 RepID=UPI003F67067B